MSALYPNVPIAAGVPAVLRQVGALVIAEQTIATAGPSDDSIGTPRYGIFALNGDQPIYPDSVVSVEHRGEFRISDYPVEGGKFESYDKVATPFDMRVALSKGGTVAERNAFLTACQLLLETFDTYNVVTPERVYLNVNVVSIGRTASASSGGGLITVEFMLQEVRSAAKAAYSRTDTASTDTPAPTTPTPPVSAAPGTTKTPAAVRAVNQGAVQPKAAALPAVRLVTASNGAQAYVYSKIPGTK